MHSRHKRFMKFMLLYLCKQFLRSFSQEFLSCVVDLFISYTSFFLVVDVRKSLADCESNFDENTCQG